MGALTVAMNERDFAKAAEVASVEIGYEIESSEIEKWVKQFNGRVGWRDWSDGTWMTWIRNRLGSLPCGMSSTSDHVTGRFNLFFLFLEETPTMRARLQKDPDKAKDYNPARSKIGKTTLAEIFPIDGTAANVVPQEDYACRAGEKPSCVIPGGEARA